jgi:hypothetical protein
MGLIFDWLVISNQWKTNDILEENKQLLEQIRRLQ